MEKKSKLILGIETSCDETAVSLLSIKGNSINIKADLVYSQVKVHAPFGGVVPEKAARKHLEILPVLLASLEKRAKTKIKEVDYIAVTIGPGLVTSLMVGVETAKTLAWLYNKPLILVNHLIGHILASSLPNKTGKIISPLLPALALVVSGGHTELILIPKKNIFKKVGATVDDAAGESFDKVANLLKLGYPGGPLIEKMALRGDAARFIFPRPMSQRADTLNYSFSGLKTAVRVELAKHKLTSRLKKDMAASFQEAAVDSLLIKLELAIKHYRPKSLILGGGVAHNKLLRKHFKAVAKKYNLKSYLPLLKYTQDNAAMIAYAGWRLKNNALGVNKFKNIKVDPNLTYKPFS